MTDRHNHWVTLYTYQLLGRLQARGIEIPRRAAWRPVLHGASVAVTVGLAGQWRPPLVQVRDGHRREGWLGLWEQVLVGGGRGGLNLDKCPRQTKAVRIVCRGKVRRPDFRSETCLGWLPHDPGRGASRGKQSLPADLSSSCAHWYSPQHFSARRYAKG